jgi:hypothetical protein
MALKYLKPQSLTGVNGDDSYLKVVNRYGDTTFSVSQIQALASYGVDASYTVNAIKQYILNEIDAGFPVGVAILHNGPTSNPSGGHWMLAVGFDADHIIVHDPYGEADMVNGGYVRVGPYGKYMKYTWANWLKRWSPEGVGHGYMMTFRNRQFI